MPLPSYRIASRACRSDYRLRLVSLTLTATLILIIAGSTAPGTREATRCTDDNLSWAIGQRLDDATYKRLLCESGAGWTPRIKPLDS